MLRRMNIPFHFLSKLSGKQFLHQTGQILPVRFPEPVIILQAARRIQAFYMLTEIPALIGKS